MSWFAPPCPSCRSFSTRFDAPVPDGPDFVYLIAWVCEVCNNRIDDLVGVSPGGHRPGQCLNCTGKLDADGRCEDCGVLDEQLRDRVHHHCGDPPRIARILALTELGLFRVGFDAVHMRLQANPDDAQALVTRAKLLIEVHRPRAAIEPLRRAIALGCPAQARVDLGIALANAGEPREAIAVYERFLAEHPDDPGRGVVLSNIGGCLSALGRLAEAETYHRRGIEASPNHLQPRWNLFANLCRRGRPSQALAVIEQTAELPFLEPEEVENIHAYRAEVLILLDRLPDALAAIDASLVGDPHEPHRLFTRARILDRLGRLEQARVSVLQVLEVMPESRAARRLLARIKRRRGVAPS